MTDPVAASLTAILAGDKTPPRIEVVADSLTYAPGSTATLYRTQEGRRSTVRGAVASALAGTQAAWVDYEAAFGVDVVYSLDVRTAAGGQVQTVTAPPVRMAVADSWITDPLAPGNSTPVTPEMGTFADLARSRAGGAATVIADSDYVAITGIRHALADAPFSLIALSEADLATLHAVLDTADPFLFRSPPGYPGPRAVYLTADTMVDRNLEYRPGRPVTVIVEMKVTAVRAPAANIIVPLRTYADLPPEASSYADWPAVYAPPTYLSVLRGLATR